MKKLLCMAALFLQATAYAQPLAVMTFNIRYNTAGDSLNAWPYRAKLVTSQVQFHGIALLGVQEALHSQVQDLKTGLTRFAYVGVGRDDGKTNGEYVAIFFDSTRFQLLQQGHFWLSETPDVPGSKGWDAQITRMATWIKLKDLKTQSSFFAFNTHFDHMGKKARAESAKLLLQKMAKIAGNLPCVLMGDLNATPDEEPLQILTSKNDNNSLADTKNISVTPHYGPTGTFNGFQQKETSNSPIDFIFVKGKWRVLQHATLSQTWQGRFASDHFSVMAVLLLP
jgi:endonuclease/exonuclease/phosphatase family metal-dependent hydrolase